MIRFRHGCHAFVLASLGTLGCALAGTRGRLVDIELALVALAEPGMPLGRSLSIDESPWEIELLEARLIIGGVYLFPPRDPAGELASWLLPQRVFAHAGDDNEAGSNAMAEHIDQVVLDALDPDSLSLGVHLAQTGRVDRGSIWLDHPRGELARQGEMGPTRGRLAWIHARATRADRVIEVEAGLDIENTPLRRRVDGIAPDAEVQLDEGMRATFGVRAGEWLREVDFSALVPPEHDFSSGPLHLRPEAPSQLHNAWQIAIARRLSYVVHVERVER